MNLSEAYHKNQLFENLLTVDETITEATFDSCTFVRCNMQQTVFDECTFNNCTFDACDISLIKFKQTVFNNVRIVNTKAIGILWHQCSNPLYVGFESSQISYSSFYGKTVKKLQAINCHIVDTDFTNSILAQANFNSSDLAGSRFSNTDLTAANFANARNYDINITNNRVKGAKFNLPEALALLHHLDIEIVD